MIYYLLIACFLYIVTLAYFFTPSPFLPGSKFAKAHQSVAILVLGDIGRSPRIQYHASSLSKLGYKVQIIGYKGTQPHASVLGDKNIGYQFVPDVPEILAGRPAWLFPIIGPLKVLHQLFFLFLILGYAIDPPSYLLVQNPPSIPSLAVAQILCYLRNTRLVIDWHNLGYSILALKLGDAHPMVRISRVYERLLGRRAYAHFTVTDSMASFIKSEFKATGIIKTLHDRPPAQFVNLSAAERAQFLQTFEPLEGFHMNEDRLVVSSTSWTPDEDFQILLDALVEYDAQPGPKLYVIITGKGPLKEHYLELIDKLKLSKVIVKCAWLSAEAYPKLLACADLGVSLHTSSSGMDLPMKVVDMFGCGLPVLALRFDCISELVIEGKNGRTFSDAQDLAELLAGLFETSQGEGHLEQLKNGAEEEGNRRWDQEWDEVASELFSKR